MFEPTRRWARGASSSRGRPAEVGTLAVLYAAGFLGCGIAAAFPMSDQTPVTLLWVVAVASALVSATLWLSGARITRPVVHLAVAAATATKTLLIAFAATPQGEIVAAFGYLWIAVYAAHFFSRREAWLHAALISVGFGVGLAANPIPSPWSAYVIVVVTIWVPVTVLSNLTTKMRRQAATDQLTGLLNRAGFRAAAEREYALAVRTTAPVCLVVIDLDGFKAVNDWRGHAAGDQMLVELAETWTNRLRRCDVVGRHGGDEFVLLLPATDHDQATRVLERLHDGSPIRWSSGVAQWRLGESFEACLSRADTNLYQAKPGRVLPQAAGGRAQRALRTGCRELTGGPWSG